MKEYTTESIRNVALVSHSSAGKSARATGLSMKQPVALNTSKRTNRNVSGALKCSASSLKKSSASIRCPMKRRNWRRKALNAVQGCRSCGNG